MSFIISILVVYGITNIIVHGKIFSECKSWLHNIIERLKKSTQTTFEDLADYKKYKIDYEYHILTKQYEDLQQNLSEKSTQEEIDLFDQLKSKILKKISKQKAGIMKKILTFHLVKFEELINCMMCTGFWIGLFYSILMYNFDINLFETSMNIASKNPVSFFLLACLFSGTCWIIDSVVDLLTDLKDKINAD